MRLLDKLYAVPLSQRAEQALSVCSSSFLESRVIDYRLARKNTIESITTLFYSTSALLLPTITAAVFFEEYTVPALIGGAVLTSVFPEVADAVNSFDARRNLAELIPLYQKRAEKEYAASVAGITSA